MDFISPEKQEPRGGYKSPTRLNLHELMGVITHEIMLADDDTDDCIFFREALEELPLSASLTTASDGIKLMQLLQVNRNHLPDVLFLDLNMPLKTGFECLSEIKVHRDLKELPVIIFSTSFDRTIVNLLYEKGANYYARKPGEFFKLKLLIHKGITLASRQDSRQRSKENFILNSEIEADSIS